MQNVIFFSILSLVYCIMTCVLFFKRDRIRGLETRVYGIILATNLFGVVLEIIVNLSVREIIPIPPLLINFLLKLLNIYLVSWVALFAYYMILVSVKNKDLIDKVKKIILIFDTFGGILILISPIEYVRNSTSVYSTGLSVNITYVFSTVYILLCFLLTIRNIKVIFQKKYYPILLFLALGVIIVPIQFAYPELTLMLPLHTFVTCVMYHTIENPDVKMLNEMYKNKELMEQGYEDKYNFLFEMTQEARGPLVNINNLSSALRMEDDPQKVKDGLLTLNNMVRQLDFSVNNILNISSLDVSKVKIVDNKYDLEKMCHDLEVRVRPEVKPTVKFYLNMPKQLPILYGDYMKIRQILYSLLVNACKNTENGMINMKVNLIEKYDVARLIFNISDTGMGMPIEKINEILSATGSLDQSEIENLEKKEFNVKTCQKVVKIMGGNLMIKSNIGEGTEVILTIDQRVYHEKDNSILNQYENAITNYRKVLIVSQNKDKLAIIKKKLSDNHITYSNLYYGADAIDRIKSGKKFDFILVEDEMKEMSGFMTLKGMQEIPGFKMPVIIMLNEDKENIKDHYLEDGFSDYLLLDSLEVELDRIIEKY